MPSEIFIFIEIAYIRYFMICLRLLLNYRGFVIFAEKQFLCKIKFPIVENTEKQKYREGSNEREKATKKQSEEESQENEIIIRKNGQYFK